MEYSIEFITSWLKDESEHAADIFTIWGMGGVGKTSLARYVHRSHYRLFEKSSFIEGIGQICAAQGNGLLDLQRKLCGDISKTSNFQAHDTITYTSMIENGLNCKKVFIVLDDIDSIEQFYKLVGTQGFYPGSKIIITTKDVSFPDKYAPINPTVKPKHTKLLLKGLHDTASLQLLSHHAFMSNQPKDGYEEVLQQVMAYCKGHPLALKVLGESLCNKTVLEWEDCVIGLKEETDSRIMKALQMSFESMQSNNDKELFKHIACFFVHEDRVFAEIVLNSCGIRTKLGIRNLIDRCLLTVDQSNILTMHQLIQEMGRDIVRRESLDKPEERSRLWCHEESLNVLKDKKGTQSIKGLLLDIKRLEIGMLHGSIELETCAFSKMHNLMLLQLNYVQLSGSYKNFPKELRWLSMRGFPSKNIPFGLPMEKLVALDMSYSKIEYFDVSFSNLQPPTNRKRVSGSYSKDKRLLRSLKILDMSFCEKLYSLGGFLELPALERLIASNCIRLIEVCDSAEQCVNLVHIDLSYCYKLQKVPTYMSKLKKLKTLLLDGCNTQSSVSSIPSDLKFHTISLLSSLKRLSLADNNLSNESFPMDLSCLCLLEELCLANNPIVSMPKCVRTLPRIQSLNMDWCLMLQSIEYPPCTLRNLSIFSSQSSNTLQRKINFHPEMSPLLLKGVISKSDSAFKIDGMVKIEAMAGVEENISHCLVWKNLEFIKGRLKHSVYGLYIECETQMYHEFGIFSIIYEGWRMPYWISERSKGPSISFTMPSSPKSLGGLNFCCTMEKDELTNWKSLKLTYGLPEIRVSNITKNNTWIYKHFINEVELDGNCISLLSHWMFGPKEMKAGDHITVTIQQGCYSHGQNTKECGIGLVYDEDENDEEEEEDAFDYYNSWNYIIGGDPSTFQLTTNEYVPSRREFERLSVNDIGHAGVYKGTPLNGVFKAFSQTKKSDVVDFNTKPIFNWD